MPPGPSAVAPKAAGAFRTIGELSAETGLPQHILRYWETRFAQLRPLQRAGNRRYYRTEDVALVRRIDQWLNRDGYTVRGVQQLLAGKAVAPPPVSGADVNPGDGLARVRTILTDALAADAA
ncbi:MAG: MerR family transcriptional regulator [Pseudomonadota bacterium]